jgi:hypothetical protein
MGTVASNLQFVSVFYVVTFSEAWNVVQLCLQTLDVTLN